MKQAFLNTTTHNIAWLHKRYLADELQLNAPFQRNPVWTIKQKSYLIDTILRGYPIPEIYMQEFTDAAGNDVYIVVDGQQRIRACMDFLAGEFGLDGDDTPEWALMKFEDLSDDDKKKIYNYSLVTRILPDVPEAELRSMFQRLNRNVVALNAQELRHATYWGEFIKLVEKISDDERWSLIGVFTPNDVRRMLDIEYVSELVVGYLHGVQNKKESLDDWYQRYEKEFESGPEIDVLFNAALGEILAILPQISDTRWRKKSDFYTLFLVFADKKKELPFASGRRRRIRKRLLDFGNAVDDYVPTGVFPADEDIMNYHAVVSRAASDLANRKERQALVGKLLR